MTSGHYMNFMSLQFDFSVLGVVIIIVQLFNPPWHVCALHLT